MEKEPVIRSPDTERQDRVPPGQRLTELFPVLHYGEVPDMDIKSWTFTIRGLVNRERILSHAEFTALPRVKVLSDIHCVTTWSRLNNLWEGVSSAEIRKLVNISPKAQYVMVHSAPDFTANLPLEDFFQSDVLFAWRFNDKPLTAEHGAPVRLVVPRLYFWKSAKWVTGVEFIERNRPGFWEAMGYHMHGDPWKEERYGGR